MLDVLETEIMQTSIEVGPERGHLCAHVGQQPGEGGRGQHRPHHHACPAARPEGPQASAGLSAAGADLVEEEAAIGAFVAGAVGGGGGFAGGHQGVQLAPLLHALGHSRGHRRPLPGTSRQGCINSGGARATLTRRDQ